MYFLRQTQPVRNSLNPCSLPMFFSVKAHPQRERARAHRKKKKKKTGFSFLRPSTVLPLRALCALKISDTVGNTVPALLFRRVWVK